MRTIIAGGRYFVPTALDTCILDRLWELMPITTVLSGMQCGADRFGGQWAAARGISVLLFPADWTQWGRAAGPIRNKEMAAAADALVAFPGDRGTANIIREAYDHDLVVATVDENSVATVSDGP